jgi:hypothetical protein
MAIYSCNLASVGKTTHASGTSGAHLRYIARPEAEPVILAEHIPSEPQAARTWMDRAEDSDRKNARLIDKVRIALPRELTKDQRLELVRDFAAELTQGRVPWFAAIHQEGKDASNPHLHLVIRDRDIETGKRVLRLSDSARDREKAGLEPKAVEWVRERWEATCNRALERAGHDARIDRRSLEAQGIDREPTIHIGPRASHIEAHVRRPESKARTTANGRVIDYPQIDLGRTRAERQAEIIDLNLEREARSPHFETRAKARLEREQRAADRVLESSLRADARKRRFEVDSVKKAHRVKLDELRARESNEARAARQKVKETFAPKIAAMRQTHAEQRADLKAKQSRILSRLLVMIDFTGRTKRTQEAARKALSSLHKRDRSELAKETKRARTSQLEAVKARYAPERVELADSRKRALASLADRHSVAEAKADQARQTREAERESARKTLDTTLRAFNAQNQGRGRSPDRSPGLG